MVRLVIDDEQKQVLANTVGVVEVADSAGHVLGYFQYQPIVPDPDFTEDELRNIRERARTSKCRWTTQQVLDHLRATVR